MKALFAKFRDGLTKSARGLVEGTKGLLGLHKLDAGSLDHLEEALYAADFGPATSEEIMEEIQQAFRKDSNLRGLQAAEIGAAVLERVLQGSEAVLDLAANSPTVVCLVGVNGSGKTTTTAKLGARLQSDGETVLVAACDTFRAAAIDQLRVWCERLQLDLVAGRHGADAAAVAFDAWNAARKRAKNFLLVDTAGRLHTKSNLMEELAKLRRVLQKNDPTAPHHTLLVVDASIGTNSLEQARIFHQSVGLQGLVVSKLDGTSRGGALVSIYRELKLPVYFAGFGETAADLQPFSARLYARALFGLPGES